LSSLLLVGSVFGFPFASLALMPFGSGCGCDGPVAGFGVGFDVAPVAGFDGPVTGFGVGFDVAPVAGFGFGVGFNCNVPVAGF